MAVKTHDQIERLLKDLEGPSRAIDDEIWHWANVNKRGVVGWRYDLDEPPRYTESLDAALTLLPVCGEAGACDEFADWEIYHINGGMTIFAAVAPRRGLDGCSFGANAAIALCRAVMVVHPLHLKS